MLCYWYGWQRRSNLCAKVSFLISLSQNVWQAWHDRDCSFRQDKAEEDGDERKKPSAHQREWVPLTRFWTVLKPWSPCNNFPVSHYSSLPALSDDYMLSKQSSKKKQIAATSAHHITHSIPVTCSLNTSLLTLNLFSFPCSHWAREERRCHTLTSEHMKKRRWDATAKSTFFWLPQYFNLLLCLQIRVLLSSLGCPKCIWHPHMGVLLPLGRKNFSLGACLALLAYR